MLLIFSTSLVGKLWVCNCLGRFLCLGINAVLPLVILSGTCPVCRHLFISNASLSWIEVNFLNQKPCILSWPGVFQFDTFLSVVLSKSVCISAFGPCSRCSSSLVVLFIHSAFSLCRFGCHILVQNRSVSFAFGCWYVLLIEFSFIILECPILSIVLPFCRYLFNLPSFASTFWYISSSCIASFSCVVFSFPIPIYFSVFIFFITFSCFRRFFLSEFLVGIPILVLTFLSWFLRGSQFSRKLISIQHKFVHFIRLCYYYYYCCCCCCCYYLITLWVFFTSALADGFPQEFEWQQVSSSLLDSLLLLLLLLLLFSNTSVTWCSFIGVWVTSSLHDSIYNSNRSKQSLDGLCSSSDLQLFRHLNQAFKGQYYYLYYNCYNYFSFILFYISCVCYTHNASEY